MNINERLHERTIVMLFSTAISCFTQSIIQVSILQKVILNLVASELM